MAQASGDAEANDPARDTTQARPATQDQLKPSPEVQTVVNSYPGRHRYHLWHTHFVGYPPSQTEVVIGSSEQLLGSLIVNGFNNPTAGVGNGSLGDLFSERPQK